MTASRRHIAPGAAQTAPTTRHAREPIEMPSETRELLQAGKLEQTCSDCGRSEAAHHYCSNCCRPMGPADWYHEVGQGESQGEKIADAARRTAEQRAARMPKCRPANPPSEFLHNRREWPAAWGEWPGTPRQPSAEKRGAANEAEAVAQGEHMERPRVRHYPRPVEGVLKGPS